MSSALSITGLRCGYGTGVVLDGLDLDVPQSTVVALLGRNGVGKSTLVNCCAGLLRPAAGQIHVGDHEVTGHAPHRIARLGVGFVPQGRRIFAPLTVEENLRVVPPSTGSDTTWTIKAVYELLPQLHARRRHRGNQLSGGEQQMLAIGRALMRSPHLLILDEPSDGLAPIIVEQITALLQRLRSEGLSVLVIEQNLGLALSVSDEIAVLNRGRIAHRDTTSHFGDDADQLRELLGVNTRGPTQTKE